MMMFEVLIVLILIKTIIFHNDQRDQEADTKPANTRVQKSL